MPSGNGSGKSREITAYSRHDCTTERTRQIPNARKCACPTNSVGPIAGLLEAARGAVDSSRRDARLAAHLQPVWNVFGDFLEIFPKGYGATVLIAACLLTSRMNVGPHGESQGKRSNGGRNGAHSSSAESPYGGMSFFIGRPNLDRSGARALLNVQNLRLLLLSTRLEQLQSDPAIGPTRICAHWGFVSSAQLCRSHGSNMQ